MADRDDLEPTPGSPNGGGDGGEGPHDGGGAEPTQEEIDALPEWAKDRVTRLNNAESIISDLKKTAGVTSVKELKGKFAPPKPATPQAPAAPKDERGEYVTHEELALLRDGYSPDELAIAKRLNPGMPVRDAVKEVTAEAAINGIRQTQRAKEVVPDPSGRMPTSGGKRFSELPKGEQAKGYAQKVESLIQAGRNSGNRSQGR